MLIFFFSDGFTLGVHVRFCGTCSTVSSLSERSECDPCISIWMASKQSGLVDLVEAHFADESLRCNLIG